MKARSTGWRSQTNHIWGHSADIAAQVASAEHPITSRMVVTAMIGEMVEDDAWPEVAHPLFRRPQPMALSGAGSALANVLIEKLHAFADMHGLFLHEYTEGGVSEKVWYGKDKRP